MSKSRTAFNCQLQHGSRGWVENIVDTLMEQQCRFSAGRMLRPFFEQHGIPMLADWEANETQRR